MNGPAARSAAPQLSPLFLLAVVVAVGLNLRPPLATVGPLLESLRAATGMSYQAAGLLTTLPVMAMGALALGSAWVLRLGMRRGMSIGLVLILLASALRGVWAEPAGLLLSALVVGVGIALVQVLLPGVMKAGAPAAAGRLMSLYVTAIMAGAALTAAFAPLLSASLGWQATMALWALPVLPALLLWRRCAPALPAVAVAPTASGGVAVARRLRAWTLALYFGIGTSAYTLILAWYVPYYQQLGWSAQQAGLLLAGLTACEVAVGLAASWAVVRWHDRRPLLVAVIAASLAGLACVVLAPLALAIPAMVLLGLGIGGLFPLTLVATLDHAGSPREAGVLVGFVQGVGYLVAGCMPFLAGGLRDALGGFEPAWMAMAGMMLVMLPMTWRLSPRSVLAYGTAAPATAAA